jgi:hypothetical protein
MRAKAEIKLRQIAMQMLFATVLVDALHAALEDAVEALHRSSWLQQEGHFQPPTAPETTPICTFQMRCRLARCPDRRHHCVRILSCLYFEQARLDIKRRPSLRCTLPRQLRKNLRFHK